MRPGRWLRWLNVSHAVIGIVAYRREFLGMASDGVAGSVSYRGERAGALWFVGSALPGWMVGRLVDVAAQAGDREAVRLAGLLGLAGGVGRAVVMPTVGAWLQVVVCARLVLDARLIEARPGLSHSD